MTKGISRVAERSLTDLSGEEGFTLLELTLVLFLSGVLTVVMFQIYPFVMRYSVLWQDRVALENQIHLTVQRMMQDARQADQISSVADSTWIFYKEGQPSITYQWSGDSLLRNNKPMHVLPVRVLQARYTFSSQLTTYAPRREDVPDTEDPRKPLKITVALTLASAHDTLTLQAASMSRRNRPWSPLQP